MRQSGAQRLCTGSFSQTTNCKRKGETETNEKKIEAMQYWNGDLLAGRSVSLGIKGEPGGTEGELKR